MGVQKKEYTVVRYVENVEEIDERRLQGGGYKDRGLEELG